MKTVYLLLSDEDGTLRSVDRPFGVAVTTEKEAKKFVKEGNHGYSQSYVKIEIFETNEEWRK